MLTPNTGYPRPRHRWTFQGFDKEKKIVFPKSFVEVSHRPFALNSDLSPIPGEISVTQSCVNSDETCLVIEELKVGCKDVTSGCFRLHGGAGEVFEEWTIHDVKTNLNSLIDLGDHIAVEWRVEYETFDYKSEYPYRYKAE